MHLVGSLVYVISPDKQGLPAVLPAYVVEVITRTTAEGEQRSYVLDVGVGPRRSVRADVVVENIEAVETELRRRFDDLISLALDGIKQKVTALNEQVCKSHPTVV